MFTHENMSTLSQNLQSAAAAPMGGTCPISGPPQFVPGTASQLPQSINQTPGRAPFGLSAPFPPTTGPGVPIPQPCQCTQCSGIGLPSPMNIPGSVSLPAVSQMPRMPMYGNFGQGVSGIQSFLQPLPGSNFNNHGLPLNPVRGPQSIPQGVPGIPGAHLTYPNGDPIFTSDSRPTYLGQPQGRLPGYPGGTPLYQIGNHMGTSPPAMFNNTLVPMRPRTSAGPTSWNPTPAPVPAPVSLPVTSLLTPPSSAGSSVDNTPAPRPSTAHIPSVSTPLPRNTDETDIATMLGYLNINSNDVVPERSTKSLSDLSNELTPLATQISPATQPFDTVAVTIPKILQIYNLSNPHDWRLSIRTHSFDKENKTSDLVLADTDFVVYEYDKCLRAKKYPLLVLSYIGVGRPDTLGELIWGLAGMEKEIHAKKTAVIKGISGTVIPFASI